jgi:WD40 repeat protein
MVRFHLYSVLFSIFLSVIIFSHVSFSDEILFHEEFITYDKQETIMYSIKDDGSGLVSLGNGAFPQRSSDKAYLSYVKTLPRDIRCGVYGKLVIKDVKSDEVLPVQNFSKVDCKTVRCPPQPKKVDALAMHHCTIKHCWSPDSKRVAYAAALGMSLRDGFVYVFDAKTRQTTRLFHFTYSSFTGVPMATSLSWSPDGKLLLFNTSRIGPRDKGEPDIYLIDPATQAARKIEPGYLPRFADDKHIIFSKGTSIWMINIDTNEKNMVAEINEKVASVSEVRHSRVLLQTAPEKNPDMGPVNLYLLNIDNHKLEAIKAENQVFYCPKFSLDGQKMTAVGINRAEKIMGYYVYDLGTKQARLLKALDVARNRGFWMGIMFGYGNHTHWN